MAVNMRRSVVIKAEAEAEKAEFVAPTLNPDTPSPIFGGSTVRFNSVARFWLKPTSAQVLLIDNWLLGRREEGWVWVCCLEVEVLSDCGF